MKIYTKTGDDGTTGLFGGGRVGKDDSRVEAYGTVDELLSVIGVARASSPPDEMKELLARLQDELFMIGAELATVPGKERTLPTRLIGAEDTGRLEVAIDEMEAVLPPLANFILPGGTTAAAALHHARTVSRRAERCVLRASRSVPVRPEVLVYLNRLSDLLFVAARTANHLSGVPDVPWAPRG
jgi:cob(I)alamin adenosyltransferase